MVLINLVEYGTFGKVLRQYVLPATKFADIDQLQLRKFLLITGGHRWICAFHQDLLKCLAGTGRPPSAWDKPPNPAIGLGIQIKPEYEACAEYFFRYCVGVFW